MSQFAGETRTECERCWKPARWKMTAEEKACPCVCLSVCEASDGRGAAHSGSSLVTAAAAGGLRQRGATVSQRRIISFYEHNTPRVVEQRTAYQTVLASARLRLRRRMTARSGLHPSVAPGMGRACAGENTANSGSNKDKPFWVFLAFSAS